MSRRISRRQALTTGAIVVGVAIASPLLFKEFQVPIDSTPHTAASGPLPWSAANSILTDTVVPVFPKTNFVVTHPAYGARGDGHTDNTAAFQKAITTCNAAGGGHVRRCGGALEPVRGARGRDRRGPATGVRAQQPGCLGGGRTGALDHHPDRGGAVCRGGRTDLPVAAARR